MPAKRTAAIVLASALFAGSCAGGASVLGSVSTVAEIPEAAPVEPDRVRPSDVGSVYVIGELLIAVKRAVEDPRTHVEAIAAEYGGAVVGGNDRFRVYQVRFGDEELEQLRQLRDEINQAPSVELATLHYLGRFDPDF